MKRNWLTIIGAIVLCPILVVVCFIIFQKPLTYLKSDGKTVAVAKRSIFAPVLTDGSINVYVGKERIFSLWEDFFDEPIFIYPFADGKRFLCDYDFDVAMLDFVVDLNGSSSNNSTNWPLDGELRANLSRMATNVVYDGKGIVRLPNNAELQEVSNYLGSPNQMRANGGYFFLIHGSWDKKFLLLDLATNRDSIWPTKK